MPRAKNLEAYPPMLFEILERTGALKGRLDFVKPNRREALKTQGRFYALRQAIARSLAENMRRSAKVDSKAEPHLAMRLEQENIRLRDLEKWSAITVCWVDRASPPDEPCAMAFMHRDQTPEALHYAEILAANPIRPLPARPAEIESQERLLRDLEPAVPTPATGRRYY